MLRKWTIEIKVWRPATDQTTSYLGVTKEHRDYNIPDALIAAIFAVNDLLVIDPAQQVVSVKMTRWTDVIPPDMPIQRQIEVVIP
jgi:hypothetical protein